MYCPDCGRTSQDRERFCPDCGYPVSALAICIEKEKEAKLGWAEKIIGVPKIDLLPPDETPLTSFATGKEPVNIKKKEGAVCQRCGADVQMESLCPECGDKLPGIFENDPFMAVLFRGLLQMTLKPAEYASNFPYPMTGGTIQPLLYPAVVTAFLVLTLPLGRPEMWMPSRDAGEVYIPIITSFLGAIVVTPILIYLSSWLVNLIALIIQTNVPLKRIVRVTGAFIFWLILFAALFNLFMFNFYEFQLHNRDMFLKLSHADLRALFVSTADNSKFLFAAMLVIFALQYGRALGGLYRFSFLKTVILAVSTCCILIPIWLYLIIVLPLLASGLI
jgi:hypothetical protein